MLQRAGIVISEADTETLFFYVERTFGGPSAVELSGTMLRKAIGLPVSQFAQELHDKKIEATSSPQIVDDDKCEPVDRENLKHQHQHQQEWLERSIRCAFKSRA